MIRKHSLAALAALAVSASGLLAGPLDPPAGPVTPTYKTLSDVEPRTAINATNTPGDATCLFRITVPGSYYLTGNVTGVPGKAIIMVANAGQVGVTIDLNGYKLFGGTSAITATNPQDSITVRNGVIFGATGTAIDFTYAPRSRVEGVTIYSSGGSGIVAESSATIRDCNVYGGTHGITVADNALVSNCVVTSASVNGFDCGSASQISGCNAQLCGADGFRLYGAHATASHCSAYRCGTHGFETAPWCVVENCTAGYAGDSGFSIAGQSTIRDCLAENSTNQGIVVQGGCTVTNNQCKANGAPGAAGLWVQGSDSHVEGNTLVGNGYGLYVSGPSNLLLRNRVTNSSVSNYYIVAGNAFAPIVTVGTNAALVNGGAAAGTLGTTDPNANLSY